MEAAPSPHPDVGGQDCCKILLISVPWQNKITVRLKGAWFDEPHLEDLEEPSEACPTPVSWDLELTLLPNSLLLLLWAELLALS